MTDKGTEVPSWCKIGRFIDVKDSMGDWSVAKVTKISLETKTISVLIDGWSLKAESFFQLKSSKIAPFRKISKGYTGPKRKAARDWVFDIDYLHQMKEKVDGLCNGDLLCENAYETTQFYRGTLYIYIENLLVWDYSDCEEYLIEVVNFFASAVKLIVSWLMKAPKLFPYYYKGLSQADLYLENNKVALANVWYELLETLNKLFALDSRVSLFFQHYDIVPEDYIPCNLTSITNKSYSLTLLFHINLFAKEKGFEAILKILKSQDEQSKVPFSFINSILLYALSQFIDSEFSLKFFTQFTEAIFKRIEMVSENELKDLQYEEILSLLGRMKKLSDSVNTQALEINKLNLFLKMIKSNYLEKRIKGLKEINLAIENNEIGAGEYESSKVNVTEKELESWLLSENIVQFILDERPHEELIKRSSTVLKFLARSDHIGLTQLDQIWNSTQGKHDSYVRAAYSVISEIVPYLKEECNDYLLQKITQVPLESYDEQFLLMIKDFTITAIKTAKQYALKNGYESNKLYGLHILKSSMLDSSPLPLWDLATNCCYEVLNTYFCADERLKFFEEAILLLQQNNSVPQIIKILQNLLKANYEAHRSPGDLIELQNRYHIKELLITNLRNYIISVRSIANMPIMPSQVYQGKFPHNTNIKRCLIFLEFLIKYSNWNISLSLDEIGILWNYFAIENESLKERDFFFKWLVKGLKFVSPISMEQIEDVFHHFMCDSSKFDCTHATPWSFKCMKTFFLVVNNYKGHIEASEDRLRYRKTIELEGFSDIIGVLMNTTTESVYQEALKLTINLLTKYSPESSIIAPEILNKFILELLGAILSNKDSDVYVIRGLQLLKGLLGDEEEQVTDKNYSIHVKLNNSKEFKQVYINQNKTLRHLRHEIAKLYNEPIEKTTLIINDKKYSSYDDDLEIKSLKIYWATVDFNDPYTTVFSPLKLISQNQSVIKTLFELLTLSNQKYADLAWNLLIALPINEKLVEELRRLEIPLEKIIDQSSIYQLLYCLNILKKLSLDQLWAEDFSARGGFKFLVNIFTKPKDLKGGKLLAMKEEATLRALDNLLEVRPEFGDSSIFLKSLLESFILISSSISSDYKPEDSQTLLSSISNLLSNLNNYDDSLLKNQLNRYSSALGKLFNICLIIPPDLQFSSFSIPIFEYLANISDSYIVFYQELYSQLDHAISNSKCDGYWDLLAFTINHLEIFGETLVPLAQKLMNKIINKEGEKNSNEKDYVLSGAFKVLQSCWAMVGFIPGSQHLNWYLHQCLFEEPEKMATSLIIPPKCKHISTRQSAFNLIIELCKYDPRFITNVTEYLNKFHQEPDWRTSRRADWNNIPAHKEKSLTGYVGLKNLGCTCYMNSVLQQLFMISTFREAVLNTPTEEPYNDNLLYQLKYIFAGLKYSDKQYINPKGFTGAFKDMDGNPINVTEQMDADEFFATFMDRIEGLTKDSNYSTFIKAHFGGLQVTELIGKDCTHRSERHEPFITIPVEVKTKNSILRGLESFVAGEILEGENAYQCDHCDAKVKAVRRVCIKHLPNFLIIALRRFEFDFDTMRRNKVNDYCEFPFDLDMEPYTQEGLERIEREKDSSKENLTPVKRFPDDYYKYTLRGIVIHSGTAESGHYYSYIHDFSQEKWFEFNDTHVGEIDPEEIPNECFGGEEKYTWTSTTSNINTSGVREKFGNAYLLLYERSEFFKSRNPEDEILEPVSLSVSEEFVLDQFNHIKKQNQRYWRSRHIFGYDYSNFVVELTKINNPPDKFLIQYFLTILLRTKEKSQDFIEIFQRILTALKENPELCNWTLEMLSVENIVKELFLYCPMVLVRRALVGVIKLCLQNVDEAAIEDFFLGFIQLLPLAQKSQSKYFSQYLEVIKETVIVSNKLIETHNFQNIITLYIFQNDYTLPSRKGYKYNDIFLGYDKYEASDETVKDDTFYSESKGTSKCHAIHLLYLVKNCLSPQYIDFLKQTQARKILLKELDNKISAKYLGLLFAELYKDNQELSVEYMKQLMDNYVGSEYYYKSRFLRLLTRFLTTEDSLYKDKINYFLDFHMNYIKNSKYPSDTEQAINYLYKILSKSPLARQSILNDKESLEYLEKWINNNMKSTYSIKPSQNGQPQDEYIKPSFKILLAKLKRLVEGLPPNEENDRDSDDDTLDNKFKTYENIEILDQNGQSWQKGRVEVALGEIILVKYKEWTGNEQTVWKDMQSEEIIAAKDNGSLNA